MEVFNLCILFRISQVRESGIFNQWLTTTIRTDGFESIFNENVQDDDMFKSEQLKFNEVEDVFILLLIGTFISIAVLCLEFSLQLFNKKMKLENKLILNKTNFHKNDLNNRHSIVEKTDQNKNQTTVLLSQNWFS